MYRQQELGVVVLQLDPPPPLTHTYNLSLVFTHNLSLIFAHTADDAELLAQALAEDEDDDDEENAVTAI